MDKRKLIAGCGVLAAAMCLSNARADRLEFVGEDTNIDGRNISGIAVFDVFDDRIELQLINTTENTRNSAQLLTGVEFTIESFTGGSLSTARAANTISIDRNGVVTNEGPVNLLDAPTGSGSPTWSLDDLGGGSYFLEFHPDAAFGIIGPPDSSGVYSSAGGTIANNNRTGQEPFIDQMARFELDLPGVLMNSRLSDIALVYGTDFQSKIVPLPSAAWMGLVVLAGLGASKKIRRLAA